MPPTMQALWQEHDKMTCRIPSLVTLHIVVAAGFVLTLGAGSPARAAAPPSHSIAADTVPLYDNLGSYHREVDTDAKAAQAYFDQGIRLQYAFNHAEAIRSYREAVRHDPSCAMCWWGIALAAGPNINAPMSPESGAEAWKAITRAVDLAQEEAPEERALIEALAARLGADPSAKRAPLDSAYARAMAQVVQRYPDDTDALTLYAASLMNLSPWFYWTGDYNNREPRPDTPTILAHLERALEGNPDHPGACHYYIHAVEAAYPQKAVACADRLARLMPGAGHIVHMPGHIYIRVGRYADAVKANEHAVHADETYIQDQRPGGLYPAAYYPHNYHFMNFAASMAGMGNKALEAARIVAPKVPVEVAKEIYWVQTVTVLPQLTAVTFSRWDEVLAAAPPPTELHLGTAMHEYARGVALAATGRFGEARTALTEVRQIAEQVRAEWPDAVPSTSPASTLTEIAVHMLAGEIALRTGDPHAAVGYFEAATRIEDEMLYEEPPLWYYPVRHSLGRALLEAARPAEAERRYREDLLRFPDNGWSLFGLARSLEAQGKDEKARAAWDAFRDAWKDADVELAASRF
jgi:tetratricopeptide (TPR) repeat protein